MNLPVKRVLASTFCSLAFRVWQRCLFLRLPKHCTFKISLGDLGSFFILILGDLLLLFE